MRTALELLALAAVAAVAAGVASHANARPAADGNRVGQASRAPNPESVGSPSVVAAMEVGGAPSSIVATARAVWVSLGLGGLAKVDPTTNDVVARVRPGGALVDVAEGFGASIRAPTASPSRQRWARCRAVSSPATASSG